YYHQLDAVRFTGDWEAWLDFFLEGVSLTAQDAVQTAHRLLALFAADRARILPLGRAAANALRIFDVLRHRPVANIKLMAARAGVSFATAARAVEALQQLGIVREITGRARERVFVYGGYLDLLGRVGASS
ncbi:MAG: helix-turn-helix domain-containing protein, partial [Verrucomicrobiae bacterium]|nr:helix-turn-helix domain-containing protein [Verrucomicrobiae bacterium]